MWKPNRLRSYTRIHPSHDPAAKCLKFGSSFTTLGLATFAKRISHGFDSLHDLARETFLSLLHWLNGDMSVSRTAAKSKESCLVDSRKNALIRNKMKSLDLLMPPSFKSNAPGTQNPKPWVWGKTTVRATEAPLHSMRAFSDFFTPKGNSIKLFEKIPLHSLHTNCSKIPHFSPNLNPMKPWNINQN